MQIVDLSRDRSYTAPIKMDGLENISGYAYISDKQHHEKLSKN